MLEATTAAAIAKADETDQTLAAGKRATGRPSLRTAPRERRLCRPGPAAAPGAAACQVAITFPSHRRLEVRDRR
jgi:hypothetical protein